MKRFLSAVLAHRSVEKSLCFCKRCFGNPKMLRFMPYFTKWQQLLRYRKTTLKGSSGWYALFVQSQQEEKVKKILELEIGDEFQYLIPKRKLRERKGGKWQFVTRRLFPGYILIHGNITVDWYYRIKRIPDVIKFLRDDEEVLQIDERELKVLNILVDKSDTVEMSTVYKQGDTIQVIDGPLQGLEGRIVSINRRKGRAKVRINFLNQEKVVELGVNVVDKI